MGVDDILPYVFFLIIGVIWWIVKEFEDADSPINEHPSDAKRDRNNDDGSSNAGSAGLRN